MKRRRLLQALAAAPALSRVPALAQTAPAARAIDETPKLALTSADAVAAGAPRFFTADQFAALARLSDILMPASGSIPGAREAGAAAFLDFLLCESPADRQSLYRDGLDRLNAEARQRYGKPFSALDASQADAILTPLREPWTYAGPSDPLARFLRAAKDDVMTATLNSREWISVVSARNRSAGGVGTLWLPIE